MRIMTKYKELRLRNSNTVISLLSADIFQLARSGIIDECGDHFHIDLDDEHANPDSAIEYLLDAVERARSEQRIDEKAAAPTEAKHEAPAGKPIKINSMKELVEHLQTAGKVVTPDLGSTFVNNKIVVAPEYKGSTDKATVLLAIRAKLDAVLKQHRTVVGAEMQAALTAIAEEARLSGMDPMEFASMMVQASFAHAITLAGKNAAAG